MLSYPGQPSTAPRKDRPPLLPNQNALLTLVITEDGDVQAHPGTNFTPEQMDLLVEATGALGDLVGKMFTYS